MTDFVANIIIRIPTNPRELDIRQLYTSIGLSWYIQQRKMARLVHAWPKALTAPQYTCSRRAMNMAIRAGR